MAILDVSVALTNPYTLSRFDVVRRPETVSNQGTSIVTETIFPKVRGVVTPAKSKHLRRRPEGEDQPKGIVVITRFALRGESKDGSQNYQPDMVVWKGNRYVVVEPRDYSEYGKGFIYTVCEMVDLKPTPPTTG